MRPFYLYNAIPMPGKIIFIMKQVPGNIFSMQNLNVSE